MRHTVRNRTLVTRAAWLTVLDVGMMGFQAVPDRGDVLRMFTINYAKLIGEQASKGSIEAGKLADFVVLSGDHLTIPVKQIESLKALATYVEGKPVYQDPAVNF